jgi:hypothetical protein
VALGFLQSLQREPILAILYCYFDESGKKGDHPVVTFSGVCIPQSRLQGFDDAWNALLRRYGIPWLHMARASRLSEKVGSLMPARQTDTERDNALLPFADCINDHFEYGLLQAMDVEGFNAMSKNARAKLGNTTDPYYIAFVRGVQELMHYVQADDKISIICDDDVETAWACYQHYRAIRRADPVIREKTVSLTFADDKHFPALQAADMLSFLARLEAKMRFYGDRYSFRKLYLSLTTDKGVGFTKWAAMLADKKMIQGLSDALDAAAVGKRPKD